MQNQTPASKTFDDLPLSEKISTIQSLAMYPALSVMLILRRNLGYRLLNPIWIAGTSIGMLVVSAFFYETPHSEALQIFAAVILLIGSIERARRWWSLRQGVRQHSFYIGDSHMEMPRLPAFVRRHRLIPRFLDPIFCLVIGGVLVEATPALGSWLVFSGFCLAGFEAMVHRRQYNRDMDTLDSMIVSEVQAETVEQFSPPSDDHRQHTEATRGIPTGLSADLQTKVEQRQRNQNRS